MTGRQEQLTRVDGKVGQSEWDDKRVNDGKDEDQEHYEDMIREPVYVMGSFRGSGINERPTVKVECPGSDSNGPLARKRCARGTGIDQKR